MISYKTLLNGAIANSVEWSILKVVLLHRKCYLWIQHWDVLSAK